MGFYIIENSEIKGPFTIGQMRSMWNAGTVNLETKFCKEGYDEWAAMKLLLPLLEPPPVATPPTAPPVARLTREYIQSLSPEISEEAKTGRAIGKSLMVWMYVVIVGIILGSLWLVRDSIAQMFGICFLIAVYFLPSFCAIGKRNAGAIFLLNLFLGWTFLGWVVALVWSATGDRE